MVRSEFAFLLWALFQRSFESADGRRRRGTSFKLPIAFGSGELKGSTESVLPNLTVVLPISSLNDKRLHTAKQEKYDYKNQAVCNQLARNASSHGYCVIYNAELVPIIDDS